MLEINPKLIKNKRQRLHNLFVPNELKENQRIDIRKAETSLVTRLTFAISY